MFTRILFTLLTGFVLISSTHAQDAVYSQFFAAPIQLNPALTGTTFAPRIGINYRNQWPQLPNAFVTYSVTADKFIDQISSGIGLSILSDSEGDGIFKSIKVHGSYAYNLQVTESFFLRGGLQAGIIQRRLDWDRLLFFDQLDPFTGPVDAGGNPIQSGEQRPDRLNRTFVDFSAGLLAFSPQFYVGLTMKHINSPDQGILNSELGNASLPTLFSLHGGAEINLWEPNNKSEERAFLSPNFIFAKQGDFHQVNVGAYAKMGVVFFGGWFRHTFSNSDAAIILLGFQKSLVRFGYSYDVTVSGLSSNTGGAHELSLTLNFSETNSAKRRRTSRQYNQCLKIFR
ncbi:MAG: type IX secretion system membrane protein PorP/SprF [Bacteroidota bacterium]